MLAELNKWCYYMGVDEGFVHLSSSMLHKIVFDDETRSVVLHRANGPVVVGLMGDDVLVKKWMMRGRMHRYYGPALNAMFDLEWYYHDSWYIGGVEVK